MRQGPVLCPLHAHYITHSLLDSTGLQPICKLDLRQPEICAVNTTALDEGGPWEGSRHKSATMKTAPVIAGVVTLPGLLQLHITPVSCVILISASDSGLMTAQ